MGLLEQIAELDRSRAANDAKFWKKLLYYFELRVPPSVQAGSGLPYFFPLVLPPEALDWSEPFETSLSYTSGAGLFVEEQGVVVRELTIRGQPGFAPKRLPAIAGGTNSILAPRQKSFTRTIAFETSQLLQLSGQRHFQLLQDTVFRTYGDLKQDPSTALGTELYFHNLKDDEHWRVIPQNLRLTRSGERPVSYPWDLRFLAIAGGKASSAAQTEDRSVLDALRNPVQVIRTGAATIRAGLQDLGRVNGELAQRSSEMSFFLDTVPAVADSAEKFVEGATNVIETPFAYVESAINSGFGALAQADREANDGLRQGLPAHVVNTILHTIDGLVMIATFPERFRTSAQEGLDRFQRQQSLIASRSQEALEQAAASQAPGTLGEWDRMGVGLTPGRATLALSGVQQSGSNPKFLSVVERVVTQGDTLAALAARHLRDARLWQALAAFNNLRHPYISEEGIPGTVRVGDTILVPSFSDPRPPQASLSTVGVDPDEDAALHALGRDLRLDPVGAGQYDMVLSGEFDFATVDRIPNLVQGLRTRVTIERGTDQLFRNLGAPRLVGVGITGVDFETARVQLVETVLDDTRVAAVRSVDITLPAPEHVDAELTVEVRGFARPERITVTSAS